MSYTDVPHTCPYIDEVKEIVTSLADMVGEDDERKARSLEDDAHSTLEQIRDFNSELRGDCETNYDNGYQEGSDSRNSEVEDISYELEYAKKEADILQNHLTSAECKIMNLEKVIEEFQHSFPYNIFFGVKRTLDMISGFEYPMWLQTKRKGKYYETVDAIR